MVLQKWTRLSPGNWAFVAPYPAFLGRGIAIGKAIPWGQCPTDGHRNQYSQQPRNKCVRYERERSSTVYAVDVLSLRSYLCLQSVMTGILHPASPVGPVPWVFHVAPGQFLHFTFTFLILCVYLIFYWFLSPASFELFSFPFYVLAQLFLNLPLGTWEKQTNKQTKQLPMKEWRCSKLLCIMRWNLRY